MGVLEYNHVHLGNSCEMDMIIFQNPHLIMSIWETVPRWRRLCNSYTKGCPPERGDNPRALTSGLSYVQVDKHSITILYHLHQCRP